MPLPVKEEDLENITRKVYVLYAKYGFDGISMDEVSRQTNICKATLYRYFTSKGDIVRKMVDFLISHLDSMQFTETENITDVMDNIREFYVKSILIAALSGSSFLADLKHRFPDTYEACTSSMNSLQERFAGFYRKSVKRGFFRDLPIALVSRQFSNMLPVIIDMNYLEKNDLTLQEAIQEYYRMFLCQILAKDYLQVMENEETYGFSVKLADVLKNDFFIDSIRR